MTEWCNDLSEEQYQRFEEHDKKRKRESIQAVRAKFQAKYDTAYENYQSAGDGRSYSAMERNEQLIEICDMALSTLEIGCPACARRERNAAANRQRLRAMGVESVPIETAIDMLYI